MNFKQKIVLIASLVVVMLPEIGQGQNLQSMTLQNCIDYAIENSENVKVAGLEKENSSAIIGETRALGLPQINASASVSNNLKIQTSFIQDFISPSIYRVLEEEDLVTVEERGDPATFPAQFGTPYSGNAGISVSQLIFDGSYFVGLRAARTVRELSSKQHIKSKVDVVEAVSKAYYGVLVAQENLSLIAKNYNRLDTLLHETEQLYKNGFAEKIDFNRVKVEYNNIKTTLKTSTERLVVLVGLLKFQMGMPVSERMSLSDKLEDVDINPNVAEGEFKPENRIEYSILETNRELYILDMKNNKVQYLPNIYANYNLGWTSGTNSFSDLTKFNNENWFRYSALGLTLNIPIFDGLMKRYRIQKTKVQQQQVETRMSQLANNINLDILSATNDYENAIENVKVQKENMGLAKEVFDISRIKYTEGVGSNREVLDADTSYKQAQNNYFGAVYDALIAKVDIEKAYGTLYK